MVSVQNDLLRNKLYFFKSKKVKENIPLISFKVLFNPKFFSDINRISVSEVVLI